MGACPHLSIQNKSDIGINFSNSKATSGGVTISFFPHINAVGTLILGKSFDMLCLIALLAKARILINFLRSLTVW